MGLRTNDSRGTIAAGDAICGDEGDAGSEEKKEEGEGDGVGEVGEAGHDECVVGATEGVIDARQGENRGRGGAEAMRA